VIFVGEEWKWCTEKKNPPLFWKLVLFLKHFGQKHGFSMLVSNKKFISKYFNESKKSNERGKEFEIG
jgi:hypothetical protein